MSIRDFKITEGHVRCSRCGRPCSNTVKAATKDGIVVRAWVECPECIEAQPDYEEIVRFFRERWQGCENYVAPHTCESMGRERGNKYLAEMWCDYCELVARTKEQVKT